MKIQKVAVLGSGVMGAQIAAHVAAAGCRVCLLDLDRARSVQAIEGLKKLKPSPILHPRFLQQIIPGSFDEDMEVLREVDWVIEAVVEKLDVKQQLFKKVVELAPHHIPITSNTSGIPLHTIIEGFDEHVRKRFFGTHFFNPPRYMRLVEIIPSQYSDIKMMNQLGEWISEYLGKGVVEARDTVNFIANRIGVFSFQSVLKHMDTFGLNIETVDVLTGKLIGRASSATFRTIDVVGIDTYAHVVRNTFDKAKDDPYLDFFTLPPWIETLIKTGRVGQKSQDTGCFKKEKSKEGKTIILTLDPKTDQYVSNQNVMPLAWLAEASKIANTPERLKFIFSQNDQAAKFLWNILADVWSYSACLVESIAGGKPKNLDEAVAWGFNWETGPFELWQQVGISDTVRRMNADGKKIPKWLDSNVRFYTPDPQSVAWIKNGGPEAQTQIPAMAKSNIPRPSYRFALPQRKGSDDPRVAFSSDGASLVDIGDGVACLVFHTKMNALDRGVLDTARKSVEWVKKHFDGMVIGNEGEHFSAGANLKQVLELIEAKKFDEIDNMVREFQATTQMIKFAPFPTVSCPFGLTLGGGLEVALSASASVVAQETYAGLVEVGVGLIPAGGGTKELALKAYDRIKMTERGDILPFLQYIFSLIGMAKTSTSGFEALDFGFFRPDSYVSLSKDHQILRAKKLCLEFAGRGYLPPVPRTDIPAAGDAGIQTFKMAMYNMVEGRMISAYDAYLGEKVATVICGGEVDQGEIVSETYLLDLERIHFVDLCKHPKTRERIEGMLKTGKPVRN